MTHRQIDGMKNKDTKGIFNNVCTITIVLGIIKTVILKKTLFTQKTDNITRPFDLHEKAALRHICLPAFALPLAANAGHNQPNATAALIAEIRAEKSKSIASKATAGRLKSSS